MEHYRHYDGLFGPHGPYSLLLAWQRAEDTDVNSIMSSDLVGDGDGTEIEIVGPNGKELLYKIIGPPCVGLHVHFTSFRCHFDFVFTFSFHSFLWQRPNGPMDVCSGEDTDIA